MFKTLVTASLFAFSVGSTAAHAAGEASSLINIKATVPTKTFYVLPHDPEFGKDETLHYNPVNSSLSSLKQPFNVKNTDGSIHAYIEGGPASLFNGNPLQNIALATTFNGVMLTATPQEVVSDAASTPGTRADLVITPAALEAEHVGDYTASYTVIFDNVPRVTMH